ncbi:hypothetical protein JCGZ_23738 [Jatropha curcas]|uniref:Aminotransferase-like plant mobile domain-containing protein n=1 Tax=Jatropha curcas TaxID=180498 RepID=A0A067JPU3_JATCU|nr:hypothetical protein JCGZ_23738 [Jatropha curcas]
MSQLSKIPASAYTSKMETLGALPDIPTFDGEPVPVSRNPLNLGTRPLQLLPLLGMEFLVRYETSQMRGFQVESVHASVTAPRRKELRDATVPDSKMRQSLEQLRDAAVKMRGTTVEMHGAAVEMHGASVRRMPNFEQLHDAAVELRDAGIEVDLGKARSGGSSTDASAFWDLLDPPMRAQVIAASFGDYAVGLRRTQPHFPPAMYALMERWNDCTHTFIFGFGEMTLTPVDYAAITGLRFTGPLAPLDARYTAQGCVPYEVVYRFWAERIRTRLAAWRELPVEAQLAAPAYTWEERDQAARSFLFYIISSQLLCTSQKKGDLEVLVYLRDLSQVGSFDWATLALAHLYHGLDVWTRGSGESNWQFIQPLEVWAYEYRIYLGGPSGDTPTESRRIPRYLAHCHHTYASGEDPEYWRSFLNDRTYPGHEVAELRTRSKFLMRGYWADRYYLGERVYDTPVAPAHLRVPHAPPRHMCLLEGMTMEDLEVEYRGFSANDFLSAGDFTTYFSSRLQARLPEVLEYTQEWKTHKTAAHYRAEAAAEAGAAATPAGPARVVLGDVPFPPGMEVVLDPGLGLGSGIIIPADLRQAPPPVQLDPEHTTHVPAQRYQELCQRFGFARSFIGRLYSERHERAEVDRLWTRLEVEGIPLDSSEEDDDGSSSDDAPPSPLPQAAAGPSRRRR